MIENIIVPEPLKKRLKNPKTLPKDIKEKFFWCLDQLLKNNKHPSLRHKKIQGTNDYWEFSITMNYRCVYRKEGKSAILLTVGKHEDVF